LKQFVTGEIDQSLYSKFREKFRFRIHQIESELDNSHNQLSNLEKAVEKCVELSQNLSETWRNSNFSSKKRLQNLLFPEGIFYNRKNDDYRTSRINLLFSTIPYLSGLLERYKNGDSELFNEIPTWVRPPGLEPGTLRL
jgi:site-specific DNA recombinase